MNDQELEALMRDYEAEVAAYKRLPQSEPTALLDRAVLTKARAAVAHPEPLRHRPPRWMAVAASFAGVAIAAGIGWRVYEARQIDAALDAPSAAARAEAFEVEVLPGSHRDRERGLDMAQLPPPPPPPPPPPAANEAKTLEQTARTKQERPDAAAAPSVEPAPTVQKSVVPDPHLRTDHGGAAALPERRQNLAAPATPAPAMADALGAVAAESAREQDASDDASRRKEALPGPNEWLERVRQLVRDRRHTEARTELYRFRQAYPDVVIPPDLRRYAP